MPEGLTWMEFAKMLLDLLPNATSQLALQVYAEQAKIAMLIALVEELRNTNAILRRIERN